MGKGFRGSIDLAPALAELPNRKDAELLLYQADGKVKALRSAIWRFSATGEEGQKKTIALNKTALEEVLGRIRGLSTTRRSRWRRRDEVDRHRYVAANDETVKAEELKADILVIEPPESCRRVRRVDGSRGCECAEQREDLER